MVRVSVALFASSLPLLSACADLIGVQSLSGVDASAPDSGALPSGSGFDASIPDALPAPPPAEDSGCAATWVDASGGDVPLGAVPNGPLDAGFVDYVCRVPSGTAFFPGKLLSGWGCYFYSTDQTSQPALTYQVLVPTGCDVAWAVAKGGVNPPFALVCGQDAQGNLLYSCRVDETGSGSGDLGFIGWGTNHECQYSLSQQALSSGSFDVLTAH
jgi:hypothetical protein